MRTKITLVTILILLSGAIALTVNVNNIETSLNSKDNLTISYTISLDNQELTNYAIILTSPSKEFTIINSTELIKDKSEIFKYNVSGIASGVYALNLRVNNPSLNTNVNSGKNITIEKDIGLKTIIPETVYVSGSESVINAVIINEGNTDLSISAYFKNALSEITVSPQSFMLKHGENKTLRISITKPESDYDSTLIVSLTSYDEELKREYPISVIIPVINLSLNDVSVTEVGNESIIHALIQNNGNMDVNATIQVRTFEMLSGFKTEEETLILNKNESLNYTKTLAKTGITGVSLIFFNGTTNQVITKELNVLNKVPLDIKLSPERLTLLGILILVLIIIIYFKYFNKKQARP